MGDTSGTQSIAIKIQDYIPLSKTIIKDCVLLELQSKETQLQEFLSKQSDLSDDLKACYDVLRLRKFDSVCVGNFRSLYIGLKVLNQTQGFNFKIMVGNELARRELDPNSSQWESAKVCCNQKSNDERYHVEIARNVVRRYYDGERETLFETKDEVYVRLMDFVLKGTPWRIVSNAESDVFFAIFFPSRIDKIIKRNTTWKHHESDRSKSIHKALEQFLTGELVTSNDHRIVIGIALLAYLLDEKVQFLNYVATWKSFPRFFDMLDLIKYQ